MGYSVGRWEGDTLVVDSFGFNDRTWLDARGLPHTEALRLTERYRRSTVGQMQVEVTAVDPDVLTTPRTTSYTMTFQPDTEMIEGVCESDQEHWVGRLSDVERTAVTVPPALLATYVGTYSGMWGPVPRTVRVTLTDGTLYASGLLGEPVRLDPPIRHFFHGCRRAHVRVRRRRQLCHIPRGTACLRRLEVRAPALTPAQETVTTPQFLSYAVGASARSARAARLDQSLRR